MRKALCNPSHALITSSNFTSNRCKASGGAISAEVSSHMHIKTSMFLNNFIDGHDGQCISVAQTGGGIFQDGGTSRIERTKFIGSRSACPNGASITVREGTCDVYPLEACNATKFDGGFCPAVGPVFEPVGHAGSPTAGGVNVICSPGYQLNTTSKNCAVCETGRYNDAPTSSLVCSTCKRCPIGTFGNTSAYPIEMAVYCQRCPRGKYNTLNGQTKCTKCPKGRFGAFPGDVDASCTGPCPVGVNCPAGSHSLMLPLPGTYFFTNDGGSGILQKPCPQGKYSEDGNSSSCKICPSGRFQASTRKAFCDPTAKCQPGNSIAVYWS